MIKLKCIRNDSKSLPYFINEVYEAENIGGQYKIFDGEGGHIIAPMQGHYVEFISAN